MRVALAIGMAMIAAQVQAATLYKCVGIDRHVTYQSEPCPKGSSQSWAKDYPDAPPGSGAPLEIRADTAAKPAPEATPAPAPPAGHATRTPRGSAEAACEAARVEVERIEAEQWLELSIERLRELDDWVREQCAGVAPSDADPPR